MAVVRKVQTASQVLGISSTVFGYCAFQSFPAPAVISEVVSVVLDNLPEHAKAIIIEGTGYPAYAFAAEARRRKLRVLLMMPASDQSMKPSLFKVLGCEIFRASQEISEGLAMTPAGLPRRLQAEVPDAVIIDDSVVSNNDSVRQCLIKQLNLVADALKQQGQGTGVDTFVIPSDSFGIGTEIAYLLEQKKCDLQVTGKIIISDVREQSHRVTDARTSVSIATVSEQQAKGAMMAMIAGEGLLVGLESGGAMAALKLISGSPGSGDGKGKKNLVCLLDSSFGYGDFVRAAADPNQAASATAAEEAPPSSSADAGSSTEQRLSGAMPEALQQDLNQKYHFAAVEDLSMPIPVTAFPSDPVLHAYELMLEHDFDNLPVLNHRKRLIGIVQRNMIQEAIESNDESKKSVSDVMLRFGKKPSTYRPIMPDTPLAEVEQFLDNHAVAFVTDANGWCLGLVTKLDLYRFHQRLAR
eukprot:Clim_evm9s168 gene=Clim_evmTU9s168